MMPRNGCPALSRQAGLHFHTTSFKFLGFSLKPTGRALLVIDLTFSFITGHIWRVSRLQTLTLCQYKEGQILKKNLQGRENCRNFGHQVAFATFTISQLAVQWLICTL